MPQNVIPIITSIDPTIVSPGATVTITVRVNCVPSQSQPVGICSTPSGAFSNLPSSVTVLSETDQVSFSATLASTASGNVTVTAECNQVEVTSAPCHVAAEPSPSAP